MPSGRIPRSRCEELESALQAREHRRRSQDLDSRCGELDRERQVVNVATDLGDRVQLWRFGLEVRAHGARPLHEEADGIATRERHEGELLLATNVES